MPGFISADSRHVDTSARGRHADEAFISAAANEPFATSASASAHAAGGVNVRFDGVVIFVWKLIFLLKHN